METEMTMIYQSFSMDFTSTIEHAKRDDGQWFTRSQYRDPRYGYKWSAWRKTTFLPERARPHAERKIRLPKDKD